MADEVTVATPSPQVVAMSQKWDLIADLLSGTDAMRAAAERWLPKEPREEQPNYDVRLRRSFLWAIYAETVSKWMGQAIPKPPPGEKDGSLLVGGIDVSGVSSVIRPWLDDFDLAGNNITTVARRYMEYGVTYGLGHLFVDHPTAPAGATLADVKDARPYAILVDPRSILGWRRLSAEGPEVLGRVRFMETVPSPASTWDDGGTVQQVRVLEVQQVSGGTRAQAVRRVAWSTYREQKTADDRSVWIRVAGDVYDARMDEIPWATVYGERTGLLMADPPLRHLADLNLAHWQSYSDYRNTLRLTAVPMLLATGFDNNDLPSVTVSASNLIRSTKPDADVRWIEFAGSALASQRQHLVDIEAQGKAIGSAVLTAPPGGISATADLIRKGESNAGLHEMVQATEDALNQAIYFMGKWAGISDPGKVKIQRQQAPTPATVEDGPVTSGNEATE